jgi:hypothetical protein
VGSDVKDYMEKSTPNLVEFVKRIKREYWQDWDVLTKNLLMNAEDLNAQPATQHPEPKH